ncbi:beta-lactamase family protein [Acuticoccus sp. M5D2P5]|uniref:serine hydrolase domain-containing protein n=1 Tax=Acuticoccus kalidii TaxID=2910977 RepID=UPI001F29B5B2|nr:serine hydrolase domain-containing protein [Acuticoccus kalidii]MCF3936601.1 beta-lactamase family protein [Acuticoccus kalidii]
MTRRSIRGAMAGAVLALAQFNPAAADETVSAAARQMIEDRLETIRAEEGVTAVIVGLVEGDGEPTIAAVGTSMTNVLAQPSMHFRTGAVAIGAQTTILLQLVDEGIVALDDTIDTWLPDYPEADKVTLRMLADCTSGYADYVTDPGFVAAFEADVFRDWTTEELLDVAFARGMVFEPGTGFQYAHTNYLVLGEALAKATDTTYRSLLQKRIIEPLNLGQTEIWDSPSILEPALHAYTTERGVFEDSTFWNPSWTADTGPMNADMADTMTLIRALAAGETISPESLETMRAAKTLGLGGNAPDRHFSLGMEFVGPWIQKTFSFGGYGGLAAYRPDMDVTLVVVATLGPASDPDINPAAAIFGAIAQTLAPKE